MSKLADIDFGYAHVVTVRPGEPLHKLRPAQVVVQHDSKAFIYDLAGYGKGAFKEFKYWVAWNFSDDATVYAPWNEGEEETQG